MTKPQTDVGGRIILGDCLEVMRGMADSSVVMTLTDIPYDAVTATGQDRAKYTGQLRKLNKAGADELNFDVGDFLAEVERITEHSIYIFCGWGQLSNIAEQLKSKGWSVRICVWHKTNPSPMNGQHLWLNATEFCVFARKPKATFNATCKHNVWQYPAGRSKVHPTEKPLDMFKHLVNVSSNEGDVVFDPCLGSGTTAVAAKDLNRNYIGIEINPDYVKIAQDRLKQEILL